MTHTIIYNLETCFIESKIQGEMIFKEVKEIITEFVAIVKEKGCRLLLSDYREATLKLSTMEIYQIPKMTLDAFTAQELNARKLKRALIAARDVGDYLFYETVAANSGLPTKIFHDIDEGKIWLLEK